MANTFLFLLLFLLSPLPSLSSPPILGLDSFLSKQSLLDPKSTNDSFQSLSSSLKKSLSNPSFTHLSSLLSSLLSLQISIPLHVKLVGSFPSDAETLISSFLSATLTSDHFQNIGANPHHLSIKHSLHLSISKSNLSPQIFAAIQSEISQSPSNLRANSLHSIPFSAVDSIIKQDFHKEKSKSASGFYLYLLKPNPNSKPYAYSYGHGDSSPAFTRCSGSLYTGKDRYLWVDLAAGPVDYGPALSGEGVLPRGEFHPLASLHGRPRSNLVADWASLISSAYQVLLVPALRIPVFLENSLLVQFIHVYGGEKGDMGGLDWNTIEKTFMDEVNDGGLLLGDQTLRFKRYEIGLSECPICSFAVSRSTNSYTSRFLFQNYTLIVSEYMDSKRLHQILSDSGDELRKLARIPDDDFGRFLPVYVFDLDYDRLLLLDRYHQAVAFRDMVIAVRTRSSQTVSDYSCNGRHVITQTRELERPLVGSILQSMWGVSPTHLTWSPRHNSTLVDYTWSVGQTPFGPFSESLSLSFVQKDAAQRNVLLTALNYTITSAIDAIESISGHGGDVKLLRQNRYIEFVQRWNLLKYKLDKAISAMSHLDFNLASYFLRSSDHDLFAIHTIVYHASQQLEASLVCFKDPPFPWAAASMAGIALLAFFYVYVKRDSIFRSKRKQF
ncbi:uncharacterized protein LOC143885141 [Tasmannia lanceolata]|uniref:uncharacterized protein LOC143885141 n=1 Tax=Tasmannia lanceolata TaxID=3420 RepID=UPI0040637B9E